MCNILVDQSFLDKWRKITNQPIQGAEEIITHTKSISFHGHTQAINWLHFCVHFKLLSACQVLADGCADGRVHYLCTLRQYFGHPLPGNKVSPLHSLFCLLVQILSKVQQVFVLLPTLCSLLF